VIPNVLVRTAEVAHEIVDVITALSVRSVQRIHSPEHGRHFRTTTTGVASVPGTVDEAALWEGQPRVTLNIKRKRKIENQRKNHFGSVV